MCRRVFVKASIDGILRSFTFAQKGGAEQLGNTFPRWNGAPSLDDPLIIMDRDLKDRSSSVPSGASLAGAG